MNSVSFPLQQDNSNVFEVLIELSKHVLVYVFRDATKKPDGQQSTAKLLFDQGLRPEHFHPHYYGSIYQACLKLNAEGKLCDFMTVCIELMQGNYPNRQWQDIIADINRSDLIDLFAIKEDALIQNVRDLIKLNQTADKPLNEDLEIEDFIKFHNQSNAPEISKHQELLIASKRYGVHIKDLKELCRIGQKEQEQKDFFTSPDFKLPTLIEARKPSLNLYRYLFGDNGKLAASMTRRAKAMRTVPDYLFTTLLPTAASVAGGSNRVIVKANGKYTQPLVFWSAIVGRSGTLKTPAQMAIIDPLEQMEVAAYEAYRQELEHWNNANEDERGEKPVRPRLMSKDSTLEALESIHYQNLRGLLVYRDELIGDLKSMGQYKRNNSDLEATLQQWNGGTVMVDRQSRNIMIPNCSISRTGAYQWSALKEALQGKIENGYNARWLFCAVQSPKRKLNLLTDSATDKLDEELSSLYKHLRFQQTSKDYLLSRDAQASFQAWNHQISDWEAEEPNEGISLVYSKIEAYTLRIALWLHLVNSALAEVEPPPTISGQVMDLAIELGQYYLGQAKLVYLMQDVIHEDALAFWEKTAKLAEPRTITQLRNNNFKRTKLRSVPVLRQLAQTLAEQGRGIYNSEHDTWEAMSENFDNYQVSYSNPFQDCDPIKILDTAKTISQSQLEPIGAVLGQVWGSPGADPGSPGADWGRFGAGLGQSWGSQNPTPEPVLAKQPQELGQVLGQIEKEENQLETFFGLVSLCNTPNAVTCLWQELDSQNRVEAMQLIQSSDSKVQPAIAKINQMNLTWQNNTLIRRNN